MREFEVVMWSCFSRAEKIAEIASEHKNSQSDAIGK
jgi:hypothetical protein